MPLLFTPSPIINAKKISHKIDLAIIIPASTEDEYMNAFKESIMPLPNHIEMGDKKVRMAVDEPHGDNDTSIPGARILFSLSGDNAALQEWVTNWKAPVWGHIYYWHDEAFELIRTEVFDFKDESRSKMVIEVFNGWPYDKSSLYKEAHLLRDKGAFIYVSWPENETHLQREDPDAADPDAYVGMAYPWRMNFQLGDESTRDLCAICKFMEPQKKCTPDMRPMGDIDPFDDNHTRCQNVKEATKIKSPHSECELECTRQWPWDSDLLCTDRSGKERNCMSKYMITVPSAVCSFMKSIPGAFIMLAIAFFMVHLVDAMPMQNAPHAQSQLLPIIVFSIAFCVSLILILVMCKCPKKTEKS